MKRFSFNLEKVLELRRYREQEAKIELGQAISILTEIENNIKQNALTHNRAVQERFAELNAGGDAAANGGAISMMNWDSFIKRLEQEAERLMEDAAKAELVVEEKRNQYLEASREVKALEKLKEKKQQEYRKEMLAAQARELDDIKREMKNEE